MAGKSPTEILKKEHKKVLKILDELEKDLDGRNVKAFEKNLAVLDREFGRHSLNKEEKALFPEIEKFMPRDGGPTGAMVEEHKSIVENIKKAREAIKTSDFKKLDENGKQIIYTLRPHIEKENDILFMIADMHLSKEQKNKVLKKFGEIDSEMR